jgi:hypothetical protein
MTSEGTETELSHRKVQMVGTFWLGPDFFSDGTVMMSDRNFFTFVFPSRPISSRNMRRSRRWVIRTAISLKRCCSRRYSMRCLDLFGLAA